MSFIVGLLIVIGSIFGGYLPHGDAGVLWVPLEFLIILGSAIGGFIIGNPGPVLKAAPKAFGTVIKGPKFKKADYLELLLMLYTTFRLAKTKGMLALEQHIENPESSTLFQHFPKFLSDHHAVDFLCDYLRLMTLGTENPHELGDLMEQEIKIHHNEQHAISHAFGQLADGLPAFGIVAAVLGVIVTMGSIQEPPEVLGGLIGGALVGTFFGIAVSYGLFGPFSGKIQAIYDADGVYYEVLKNGLIAHLSGYAPAVSIEFARKAMPSTVRPSFKEVEDAVQEAPTP